MEAKAKGSMKRKHVEEKAETEESSEAETDQEEEEAEAEVGSPNGVMEANFSCESSNDSWDMGTIVSASTLYSHFSSSSSSNSSKRIRPTR